MGWMNLMEIANETLVIIMSYYLFLYSDGLILTKSPFYPEEQEMVKDYEMQTKVGWSHVGLLGMLLAFNIAIMLVVQIAGLKRKVKISCLKRK